MKTYLASLAFLIGLTAASPSHAQMIVMGQGDAALCYRAALTGDQGSRAALKTCTDALKQNLIAKDDAATHVNRGVLHMRAGMDDAAAADFAAALESSPDLIEAHINYAAFLIRQNRLDEAQRSLDVALADEASQKRPEALYNRAVIHDARGNYKLAYFDLKAALSLRPDWAPARKLISQYEVHRAG